MIAVSARRPEISVCVGCYNQRQYLTECLDSITSQRIDVPIEILVGDDASTDGSAELIQEYARADSRLIAICRPHNLPFLKNHRDLLARAKGEFVAICDGDDYWTDPEKLAKQLAVMRRDPDVTLCITAGMKVNAAGDELLGTLEIGGGSRYLSMDEIIAAVGTIPTASIFMRRSSLMRIPQESYDQPVLDYTLQLLVGAQGAVWYDASVTCAYRMNAAGSWTEALAKDADKYLGHHEASRSYVRFLEANLSQRWHSNLRRAFEPLILGFYMSSRIGAADKLRNLPKDLPRLSLPGKAIATSLARAPAIVRAGAVARRHIWSPVSRYLKGRGASPGRTAT